MAERKTYQCKLCSKFLATRRSLKRHEMRHCDELKFQCKLCSKKFKTDVDCMRHTSRHSGKGKTFKCTSCEVTYRTESELLRHTKYIHDTSSNIRYECIFCERKFPKRNKQFVHLLTHTQERVFLCKLCPKEYSTNQYFQVHSQAHTPEGLTRIPCDLCPGTFVNKVTVNEHISRVHTGERAFKCGVCEKRFATSGDLKIHMTVHSTLSPFNCKECDKTFKSKRQLKRHCIVHTGQRNHACPLCTKGFFSKQNFEMHLRTHTGEKAFKCEICGKCLATPCSLRGHKLTHAKKKVDGSSPVAAT